MVTEPTPRATPVALPTSPALTGAATEAAEVAPELSRAVKFQQFAKAAATRGAWTLFMHIGTPVVALTAPFLIEKIDGDARNNVPANLVVGSAMGGAWGALVGAIIPVDHAGERVPRIKAIGLGMGGGLVIGPVVSGATRLVIDWFLGVEQAGAEATKAKADATAAAPG